VLKATTIWAMGELGRSIGRLARAPRDSPTPGRQWLMARDSGTGMQHLFAAIFFAALWGPASAQDHLAPAPGMRELFDLSARGIQIYVCRPSQEGFAWAFEAPQAVLYGPDGKEAGRHARGPSWTLTDGSSVTAEVLAKEPSPEKASIPWLLLKVTSHQGTGRLDKAEFIRRTQTSGGAPPAAGCDGAHQGEMARVPYGAVYQFFGR